MACCAVRFVAIVTLTNSVARSSAASASTCACLVANQEPLGSALSGPTRTKDAEMFLLSEGAS